MANTDTKTRILETAERLFASEGLSRTSLRAITCEAGVNVAAVHYHFGSKDALLAEVVRRRVAPMNEERLARIDAIEANGDGQPPPLEPLLRAYIEPAFLLKSAISGQEHLAQLFGRLSSEPEELLESTLRDIFEETAKRFRNALARAVPELPLEELDWRLHFLLGGLIQVMMGRHAWHSTTIDTTPEQETIERLISFAAAGLRAPFEKDK